MVRKLAFSGCAALAAALLAGCQESRSHARPQPQYHQTHPPVQQQPAYPQPSSPQPQQFAPPAQGGSSSQPSSPASPQGATGYGQGAAPAGVGGQF